MIGTISNPKIVDHVRLDLGVSLFGWLLRLQFFSLGMLAEMNARIYVESQVQKPYAIRRITQTPSESQFDKAA